MILKEQLHIVIPVKTGIQILFDFTGNGGIIGQIELGTRYIEMNDIYQILFFLGIGFLAIDVTIFVLAVSLLGRAVKLSVEEQTKLEEKAKADNEVEMEKLQDSLKNCVGTSSLENTLKHSLRNLQKKDNKHKRKLIWIKMKPEVS